MIKPILLRSAAELLEIIFTGQASADDLINRYFRAHPKLGARDRGFITETVYACLRQRRVLEHVCAKSPAPAPELVAALLLTQGDNAQALEAVRFIGDIPALAERARLLDVRTLPAEVRANLPGWLAQRLQALLGVDEMLALAEAFNQVAPVDLRVNTLKAERETVQARLAEEGFACSPTPYSPVGLRCTPRTALAQGACFKEGLFEIQDEGSQLLALMLEPKRNETIVDFCAGAGGKTLHLGTLMANTGTVYAFDVSIKRLERLKPRLQRSGLKNVRLASISHEQDAPVQRLHGKIDRVLVDAPCSGVGTLRRSPDIKWRPIDLAKLADTQTRILSAAAELVKPGGRLVYATCSLLREENDGVVESFLAGHPEFSIIPVTDILARRRIPLSMEDAALRLYPQRHLTDGFYAMALERMPG